MSSLYTPSTHNTTPHTVATNNKTASADSWNKTEVEAPFRSVGTTTEFTMK